MAGASITAAGMRVIRLLVGRPPRTITELTRETGVTRTAVTEQLNEMVAAGFVERTIERQSGRGRPRHRYAATQAALVFLFANNQQLVVPAIWKAVNKLGGKQLTRKVLHSVSRLLSQHYLEQITATDPRKRIEQYKAILQKEGGLLDLAVRDGVVMITKRTCAFISMFEEQRHVCTIDLAVIAKVAGCPARLVCCRHNGDPCCKVEIDTRVINGSPVKRIAAPNGAKRVPTARRRSSAKNS